MFELGSHRRFNPLLGEWIVVCKDRLNRPWKGAIEETASEAKKDDGNTNYLAPGGIRANGMKTPDYKNTFVFENDFPAFNKKEKDGSVENVIENVDDLFITQKSFGITKVVCFHPDSTKRQVFMTDEENEAVVQTFIDQLSQMKADYDWIQIFENHGQIVGCSNPHPHCQIWATTYLPNNPERKDKNQKAYFDKNGRQMLLDYLAKEQQKKERIVLSNDHWTVVVPFWAYWPFETMLLPNRHVKRLDELTQSEIKDLAKITKQLLIRYDNIFKCDFPFLFGWHGAPTGKLLNENHDHWQLHAVYYPPLVRSATIKKFLAGYEVMCEPQRDFTPEKAAEILRAQSASHYTENTA
uniref:UDP-glucose--hexose-1-phosphate uridylyltransferase n=1 Tax=Panagrolaimus sp. JU765 TaxID=591449 RepID=A0AC34PVZ3_9BILA